MSQDLEEVLRSAKNITNGQRKIEYKTEVGTGNRSDPRSLRPRPTAVSLVTRVARDVIKNRRASRHPLTRRRYHVDVGSRAASTWSRLAVTRTRELGGTRAARTQFPAWRGQPTYATGLGPVWLR
ncbi:unnamed protein product, partial [Iphiclides podalirius]